MTNLLKYIFVILFCQMTLYGNSLQGEKLVAIHGYSGAPWNMYFVAKPLEKEQMSITYWGYPSKDKLIEEHAADLVAFLQNEALKDPGQPIHFLTHSMGGLVLRAALNHPECPPEAQIGRAVLLVPPNQGTAWGRLLGEFSLPQYIAREYSGQQLLSELDFEHLGQFPDAMEVLVIAGNFGINYILSGENDGVVTVEETYLSTPHKHIVLNRGHKTILLSQEAANLAHDFIKDPDSVN